MSQAIYSSRNISIGSGKCHKYVNPDLKVLNCIVRRLREKLTYFKLCRLLESQTYFKKVKNWFNLYKWTTKPVCVEADILSNTLSDNVHHVDVVSFESFAFSGTLGFKGFSTQSCLQRGYLQSIAETGSNFSLWFSTLSLEWCRVNIDQTFVLKNWKL